VVKPGGRVVCLEITWPTLPLFRQTFGLYFGRLVPFIGGLVSGQPDAYAYLPRSVAAFASARELATLMAGVSLRDGRYRRLALGAVALHVGTK
jgi:demethylmenaquinone methyltransferase/2-methoxy-6-polyprenyl-1,4-benzoquinol methylase